MKLTNIRYYLELIALPFFIYLIVHLGSHGYLIILGKDHQTLESGLTIQSITIGIILLCLFVWSWQSPSLNKWIPCRHEGCTHTTKWPHILATIAFMLHFFPEAEIRHHLLEEATASIISTAGIIAFLAHFLVDIIVAIHLSQYWKKKWKVSMSFILILGTWIIAFLFGENSGIEFHGTTQGITYLISAFVLSMFVHLPHRN